MFLFKAVIDEKAVMGRKYKIMGKLNKETYYIIGGDRHVIANSDKLRQYEQPAHFHKAEAEAMVIRLNNGEVFEVRH